MQWRKLRIRLGHPPAVESVLKVYSAILQQKPDAKWKPFDDLLKKQSQGKLDDALRKTV
jgi:hypothetical protein